MTDGFEKRDDSIASGRNEQHNREPLALSMAMPMKLGMSHISALNNERRCDFSNLFKFPQDRLLATIIKSLLPLLVRSH